MTDCCALPWLQSPRFPSPASPQRQQMVRSLLVIYKSQEMTNPCCKVRLDPTLDPGLPWPWLHALPDMQFGPAAKCVQCPCLLYVL